MIPAESLPRKSRLTALLEHFAEVEDPRDVRRILHPLPEVLLLVVCGTIADCDDYEDIAGLGCRASRLPPPASALANGVPGERWLTILMNRIKPGLLASAFAAWVRESWPDKAGLIAIDGKTSRRSHDRSQGAAPLHLVSAFATSARLVLAAEAVPDKAGGRAAIPPLLERLGADDGLKGALVSIDAVATNAEVARVIAAQGADWLLAVKANQPSLRAEVEAAFAEAGDANRDRPETHADLDKSHGRPHRARPHHRPPRHRLARWRPPFPGRTASAGRRLPRPRRDPGRSEGNPAHRGPLLHLLPRSLRRGRRHRDRGHWAIENRLRLGSSTSPSPTTTRASAGATAPATWRPSATSPSTSSAPPGTSGPSSPGARSQAGIPDCLDLILASRPD